MIQPTRIPHSQSQHLLCTSLALNQCNNGLLSEQHVPIIARLHGVCIVEGWYGHLPTYHQEVS